MNRRYYQEIMQEYAQLRDKQELERQERTRTVYEQIPEIEAIDKEMARLGMEIARWVLKNPADAEKGLREIQQMLSTLQQRKSQLLKSRGLSESFLELQHQCPQCKDTGHLPDGHPCRCLRQRLIQRAYSDSNLEVLLKTQNFKTFNPGLFSEASFANKSVSPRKNMAHNHNTATFFVEQFESISVPNLLFYGDTGLGKTFLCSCIAKALLDRGYTVLYQTSFRIAEALSTYKFGNREDPEAAEPYRQIYDCDLLIVDDLGTELTNAFTNAELFNIINTRLMAQKKMVFSTNLSPVELRRTYGDRISSRLLDQKHFELLEFFGDDLRLA